MPRIMQKLKLEVIDIELCEPVYQSVFFKIKVHPLQGLRSTEGRVLQNKVRYMNVVGNGWKLRLWR